MWYDSWNEFIISGTVFSISKFLATASDIKASAFSHNSVTFTSLFLKIVAVACLYNEFCYLLLIFISKKSGLKRNVFLSEKLSIKLGHSPSIELRDVVS